jgi:uncharacterized membrane protein
MKLRKMEIVNLAAIVIVFAVAAYLYPLLPARVASHWDINGQVNGYMGRFWGAFFVPVLTLGLYILFIFVPRIDPKKENIEKFRSSFDAFVSLFLLFMFYIYALTILWAFGHIFNMSQLMIPAFALLIFAMSVLVKNAEPNWSIGIRTPWTLSSEVVWRKTHAFGNKLFALAAILTLLGIFFPGQALWFVIVPIIACSLIVVVYSYVEFTKLPRT